MRMEQDLKMTRQRSLAATKSILFMAVGSQLDVTSLWVMITELPRTRELAAGDSAKIIIFPSHALGF